MYTNTIFPSVTSYPTALLIDTITPSIIYQRQINIPITLNCVSFVGAQSQKLSKHEQFFDEKNIDDYIKKRVEEQMIEYKNKKDNQNLEKYLIMSESRCNCKNYREKKELTLDEKIERIREELNLKADKDKQKIHPKFFFHNEKINKLNFNSLQNDEIIQFENNIKPKFIELNKNLDLKNFKFNQDEEENKENDQIINFEASLDEKLRLLDEEETSKNLKNELENKILEYQQNKHCEHSNNLKTHYRIASKMLSSDSKMKNEKKKKMNKEILNK